MTYPTIRKDLMTAAAALAIAIALAPAAKAQEASTLSAAELAAKGAWVAATIYVKDDIVTERGSAWIAKRNNKGKLPGQTSPSTAADWQLFARGFNPLGAWSNTPKYQPDDLVTFNGQTFRARITHANRQPAANQFWELLVTKGVDGAPGTAGIQGIQGVQGPAGPNTGIGAGTVGAPSISFAGDATTGIYQPEFAKIGLAENGVSILHTRNNGTAFGAAALSNDSGQGGNVAVGTMTLFNNTLGAFNVAVGEAALSANVDGIQNTALGWQALKSNTSGAGNIAVGANSLLINDSGSGNIVIGSGALAASTSGSSSTAIGAGALNKATVGGNTAVGPSALAQTTTGAFNTAFGDGALTANITGSNNTAIGNSALGEDSGSANNTIAIGSLAGGANRGPPTASSSATSGLPTTTR